ncbi:MAG TPA: glycosyltransferase family 4 protein [Thermoanaerobaculia bacterium]|nr:glycosyltransferase family 4 protein [Thermoanaerobaculia bacterium]
MRLLWIATKSPLPAIDGGRLVAWTTLEALAGRGAELTLVAPVAPGEGVAAIEAGLSEVCRPRLIPVAPGGPVPSLLRSALGGRPYTITRHSAPALSREVERLVASGRFDAVHAEQVQAFAQAEPALRAGLPVVLRAQNVESDLWRSAARLHPWAGPWLAREARRLARYEGEAVRRAAVTVALTEPDAARLRQLAGGRADVVAIPPPFPAKLPAADHFLPGEPPLVLLGSGGWLPNRDATRWFLAEAWPEVRRELPGAVLHLYAEGTERPGHLPAGVAPHPPPADSRDAFAPGAILTVQLRIGSGIRMKILEAWARGVPVVASREAAAGLEAEDGRELLLAEDGPGFAAALGRLASEPGLRERLLAAGRRSLAARHDPATVGRRLLEAYRLAAEPPRHRPHRM